MPVEVLALDDAVAAEAAARIAAWLAAAIGARGRASIALSGGRTPGATYRALAHAPLAWDGVHVYFCDERAVPAGDPESNARLARDTLGGVLAPGHLHRMEAERADLERAAADYEAALPEALDVLVLGVGEDGHTCSLFPGAPLVRERTRRVGVVRDSPKPPSVRMTLTPAALAMAHHGVVLATGAGKAAAVARALAPDADPTQVPAALLRARLWLIDRAAAPR